MHDLNEKLKTDLNTLIDSLENQLSRIHEKQKQKLAEELLV